jgi:hypothetical protein
MTRAVASRIPRSLRSLLAKDLTVAYTLQLA